MTQQLFKSRASKYRWVASLFEVCENKYKK